MIVSYHNCSKRILAQSLGLTFSILCNNIYDLRCLYGMRREDRVYKERHSNNWISIFCAESLFLVSNCSDDDEFIEIISELSTSPKHLLFFNLTNLLLMHIYLI